MGHDAGAGESGGPAAGYPPEVGAATAQAQAPVSGSLTPPQNAQMLAGVDGMGAIGDRATSTGRLPLAKGEGDKQNFNERLISNCRAAP